MKETVESAGGYSLLLSISTFSDCLAEIEAISYIFGYGEYAQTLIDTLRTQMYAISQESAKQVEARGAQYTGLGIYANNDWTFASNSGIGVMFEILKVKNVYTKEKSGNWEEENVIKAQPQVIVFCISDPTTIDWDQAMRVPTATS
jgi:ABC-type Fe3+-hydroxamate transport system substrate-binding protein